MPRGRHLHPLKGLLLQPQPLWLAHGHGLALQAQSGCNAVPNGSVGGVRLLVWLLAWYLSVSVVEATMLCCASRGLQ